MVRLCRRASPAVGWMRSAPLLLVPRIQRWGWALIVVGVIACIGVALALDLDAALTNALTEAASVLAGVAITVFILDRRQRTREREREGELRRAGLTRELSLNLTKMVRKAGATPMPDHRYISLVMRAIELSSDDLAKPIDVSQEHAAQLALGLVGSTRFDDVRTDAIKFILASRVYWADSAERRVHDALERLTEDTEHLRRLELPGLRGNWRDQLLHGVPGQVPGGQLVSAYQYHNVMENIFNEHLSLLRWLLGSNYVVPERRPVTPLKDVEQEVAAERFTPDEILELARTGQPPFPH